MLSTYIQKSSWKVPRQLSINGTLHITFCVPWKSKSSEFSVFSEFSTKSLHCIDANILFVVIASGGKQLMEKDRNTCFPALADYCRKQFLLLNVLLKKSFSRLETNPHLSSRRGPAPDLTVTQGSWRGEKKSLKLDGEDEAAHGSGNAFSGTSGASWCRCVDGCAPNKAEGSIW